MADSTRYESMEQERERMEAERLRAEIRDESLARDYRDNSNDGIDWTERWNAKVDEVDAKIIDFFKRTGAEIEQLYEDVRWQFKRWAEDARENTEQYEREHRSAQALRSKVDQRIDELDKMGRIERQRDSLLNK
ncbi:hypothetical protein IT575_14115 [bacterium]|nr:hypothetical protein [bacterium]